MPQDEAILVPPATVDPTEVPAYEKPPLNNQRLSELLQVLNYQKRYASRFQLVMEWLFSFGVPTTFERITREAGNPGNPAQSYVSQTLTFVGTGGVVSTGHDITLTLRDPLTALVDLADVFGLHVPDGTRFPEPEPPDDAAKPCPFIETPNGVDPRDPNTRLCDSDSVGYNPGDTWTAPDGTVWKMERAWSWFAPYHRWRKAA